MSTRARSGKSTRGQSSSSHEPTIEKWVRDLRAFDNDTHQMNYNALVLHSTHPRTVIDWSILTDNGGEQRTLSLVELGWRVGLYSKAQGGEHGTVTSLYNSVTVKAERLIMEFWLTIGDGVFVVEHTVAKRIRDPRIRLAHHCIATTISGCKDSTQRIMVMDLFYLYCIYGEGVVCNIPYWEMLGVLSVEPHAQFLEKKSLIAMEIVMELAGGGCHWPATRPTQPLEEDDKDEEAAEGTWMGQQDTRWGQLETWMTMQDQRFEWMYAHTICQMQYLSTRDHLETHLQIDPFPGRETNYPPFGYTGPMPPGYDYLYNTAPDGPS
ncbi:hypothetical protein Tco_1293062 [Tanacetum coccineum]